MEQEQAGRRELEDLRGYLAARDVGCPSCGFNLRGLNGRLCPECAAPLRLGLSGPRRRDVLDWVTMTLAAGLGFGLVLSAVVIIHSAMEASRRGRLVLRLDFDDEHALLGIIVFSAYAVGLTLWLAMERSIRRTRAVRSARVASAVALTVAVGSIAGVVAMMAMVGS